MRWRVGSLVALIAVTVACSSGSDNGAAPTAPTAPADVSASSPTGVPAALDISAPAVGGGEVDLRTYAGRDVALWFWAPY